MEKADDAIDGGMDGQQQASDPPTSMTTGNGSDINHTNPQSGDDFDTDSKWEITTLEKASYDCSDMYAEASPDRQNPTQQAPESASDTNQSAEFNEKLDDSQLVTEETIAENSTQSNDEPHSQTTTEDKEAPEAVGDCTDDENQIVEDKTKEDVHTKTEELTSPPSKIASQDCVNHQDHPTLEKVDPVDLKDSSSAEEKPNDENLHADDKIDSLSPQHQQDDGAFSLSQTAVDPQMEKMIDNIVEHGGCQQFAETLQQQAEEMDREREVENIQREITRASNSIMRSDESTRPVELNLDPPPPQHGEELDDGDDHSFVKIETLANQIEVDSKTNNEKKGRRNTLREPKESIIDTQATDTVSEEVKEGSKGSVEPESDSKSVESMQPSKQEIIEDKEVKDVSDAESESEKRLDDKKSLPERPVRQARLRASKRAASPEPLPKEAPEKRKKTKELETTQERQTKQKLVIKVPSRSTSSRKTIATSEPSNIPETKKVADTSLSDFEFKKYRCEKCKYSTDRLNNIVHHKKSTCSFYKQHSTDYMAAQIESWKRKIQSPKSNSKRSAR